MAEKKNVPVEAETQVEETKDQVENQVEETKDPWEEMVEIVLDRAPRNEQNFLFAAVNGRNYQIPRDGKPHEVPRPIADVVREARAAKLEAQDRLDAMAAKEE